MNTNAFKILPSELRLDTTLKCGQSFRWKRIISPDPSLTIFRSALRDRVVTLIQSSTEITYSSVYASKTPHSLCDDTRELLHDYLNLGVDLAGLYRQWSDRDPHFRKVSAEFLGLRMLRQDPFENLLSFICSSNNNISRITTMVQNLCRHYGTEIATIDGETYYSFPDVKSLLHPTLTLELRELGFGYRAKFIAATAQQVAELPPGFLSTMRAQPYEEVHATLMRFTGVGAKVADCVCLMSLDKHMAVPVDTHVLQIAQRDYKIKVKGSTMTKASYDQIKKFFIDLWGGYAGWAHSVLFTADLKAFQTISVKVEPPVMEAIALDATEGQITAKTQFKVESVEEDVKGQVTTQAEVKLEPTEQDLKTITSDSGPLQPLSNTRVSKRPNENSTNGRSKRRLRNVKA